MKIVVAAGGTGGHIFPAISLIKELEARDHKCLLLTDKASKHLTDRRANVLIKYLSIKRMSRGMPIFLWSLIISLMQSMSSVRSHKPDVIVAFGGYPTLPVLIVAYGLRIPIILHEANAVLGRVNKLFMPVARKIACCFPNLKVKNQKDKLYRTGIPVSDDIKPTAYPEIKNKVNILVIGGSQGARVFSQVIPAALKIVSGSIEEDINVLQQCSKEDILDVNQRYKDAGLNYETATFFDDMAEKLSNAHIIICRAGASTIAEILTVGRPAIYVPYPHAKDDHQMQNAKFVIENGGGIMIKQEQFDVANVTQKLIELLGDQKKLDAMANVARKISIPNASGTLADLVEEMINGGSGKI